MANATEQAAFDRILDHLRASRGFDFTAYKRAGLLRRVLKRMHAVDVETFDGYFDYLQVHPDEFGALFNTILINATGFFRDTDVWHHLRTVVIPQIITAHSAPHPIARR